MEPCFTVFFELNKIVICSMPSLVRGANGTVSEIRQVGDIFLKCMGEFDVCILWASWACTVFFGVLEVEEPACVSTNV